VVATVSYPRRLSPLGCAGLESVATPAFPRQSYGEWLVPFRPALVANELTQALAPRQSSLRKLIPLADRVLVKRILPKTQVGLLRCVRLEGIVGPGAAGV
jgi:hypothetical protein